MKMPLSISLSCQTICPFVPWIHSRLDRAQRANFIPNLRSGRANELLNYSTGEVQRMAEELATTSSRRRISLKARTRVPRVECERTLAAREGRYQMESEDQRRDEKTSKSRKHLGTSSAFQLNLPTVFNEPLHLLNLNENFFHLYYRYFISHYLFLKK